MRLSHEAKIDLARRLVEAALARVRAGGRLVAPPGQPVEVVAPPLTILHTTPQHGGAPGFPALYGVDIWWGDRGKVFSAWWEPFEVVAFRYGPWMNALVPDSFMPSTARH